MAARVNVKEVLESQLKSVDMHDDADITASSEDVISKSVDMHNGTDVTTSGECCTCKVGSGMTEGFKCLNEPGPTTGCYKDWARSGEGWQAKLKIHTGLGDICKGSMVVNGQKYACWAR